MSNPIVGQDGVEGNTGTVSAKTQRVVLATNVALPAGTNNVGDVDVASVPAPLSTTGTGTEATALRVTVATDSTGVLSVDDNGATLSVDDGAGSLTVDGTVTTTPPANASSNVSQINGVTPLMGNGSTGTGSIRVTIADNNTAIPVASHAVTNAGTFATQVDGAALTALQLIDDIVYTDDTSTHATGTSKGALIMAAAVPTDTSVNANDIAAVAMTTDRKLHVAVMDALPAGSAALGQVTANAGTNLNTSLLALEAGGNLAAQTTALQIIDDWDESDRAKTNPIVGQAGVQGASGTVSANTQRVVLATDVALPAGTNNIGDVDVLTLPALAAGTNNIGDVDVLTVPAPLSTTGGGTEAAALRVTIANNSTGLLSVNSHAVTNAGTFAVQIDAAALASLALIDDMIYVDDTATHATGTSKGALIMAAAVPTDTAVNANDIGAVAMTLDRKLHVSVQDAIPAGTNNIGDVDVLTLPALAAGTNNIGDIDVLTVPAPLSTTGTGTEATALRVTVATDSTGVLSVDDNGGSLTVDGTVTANAGTNLNTSALALETGGNLAAATTALQIMDDWDETNRAAVNTIAGQIGVQGASGTVTALTQRVVLATDVALPAGTNAIGKLSANSGVDIGDVDVTSLPALAAGTNLVGRVSSSDETSTIYNGTTALTPKFAIIDGATSGDNTLVAAVAAKKVRVHQLFLVAAGTVNVRFESGAGGTALTGHMNLVANSGFSLPYSPVGWFETASNTLLNMELSAAVSCDGSLVYSEV